MAHRTIVSFAAAALVGIMFATTISTDAFARRGVGVGRAGVGRVGGYHGVHRGGVYGRAVVRRGVAVGVGVGVGAAAAGAYYARPQCGYYPYPPCY